MPHDVTMPQLGMAQDAGRIVSWFKASGDPVDKGDVLFAVETDKATVEVEAQAAGYLSAVTAAEGDDVPVGQVIAQIADAAEEKPVAGGPENTTDPAGRSESDLPTGTSITMPQLGMTQDTGVLVGWQVAPGEAVCSDDVLFEVETDKSTMEVPAGVDGFLAATLAQPGEEVPVGAIVAIVSPERPSVPVARSVETVAHGAGTPELIKRNTKSEPVRTDATPVLLAEDGRVLASPKTRRLALEQGLDLARLVASGHPQPYHVRDLDVLKALPHENATAKTSTAHTRRLTAELPKEGFSDFVRWALSDVGIQDENSVLAGLAGASLERDTTVIGVESAGRVQAYAVPTGPLGAITSADPETAPDLRLRDLRMTRISAISLGSEDAPVLTITAAGEGLSITLECADNQLSAAQAVTLLSNFAGRMEQPLRHLL